MCEREAVHGQESEVLESKADTMRDELFVPYESTESDTSEEFCDGATDSDSSVGDSDSEVQPEAVQLLLTPAPPLDHGSIRASTAFIVHWAQCANRTSQGARTT